MTFLNKLNSARVRIGKTFANEIELSDGITIMKVTRQGSGEEPLS